jgi:hypothetical protein
MQVDAEDRLSVVYPNSHVTAHTISPGQAVRLPTLGWNMKAGAPVGKTLVAFFVTTADTTPEDLLTDAEATQATTGVHVSPKSRGRWGIARVNIDVLGAGG